MVYTVIIRLTAPGAYYIFGPWEWALIRGGCLFEAGRLLNFRHSHVYSMLVLQQKINGNNKKRRCNKVRVSVKCSEENSVFGRVSLLLIISYLSLCGREWGEGGRYNFAAFRMGAYSRWALIRVWALIRINTVFNLSVEHFWRFVIGQQERIW